MVWKTLVAQHRTRAQCNSHYGPGRVSNQGHLGERRALYAQANHVYHIASRKGHHASGPVYNPSPEVPFFCLNTYLFDSKLRDARWDFPNGRWSLKTKGIKLTEYRRCVSNWFALKCKQVLQFK